MFTVARRCNGLSSCRICSFNVTGKLHGSAFKECVSTFQVSDPELLYHYSAGRWLWNESVQFQRRFRKFNVTALAKIGASATGSASCIGIKKLPDGNFNKAFLLHMNDGKNIIAKIPNPNAGRPYFTTESEVATMDYAKNVLDIPVPEVLAWCSDGDRSPVGAEYIIMEKAQGIPLSEVWDIMKGRQKAAVIRSIINMESKFASTSFPLYGALYYSGSIARVPGSEVRQRKVPRNFVVGPFTGRAGFDDLRAEVNDDHGPWHNARDYFLAVADRERACIERFDNFPRQQGIYNAPGLYCPTSATKLSLLSQARAVIPALLSTKNLDLSSIMWHPDLHADNIFVNPDDPTCITGIIDWQAVHLSPLFLQARYPSLIDVDGPVPEGFVAPKLPENFETLSGEEQVAAKRLKAAQTLFKLYEVDLFQQAPNAFEALHTRHTLPNQILGLLGSIFDDGEPVLKGMLIALSDQWDSVIADHDGKHQTCPLSFSEEERQHQVIEQHLWEQSVGLMAEVIEELGAYRGWDGWVSHEEYGDMARKLTTVRERFLRRHAATQDERNIWAKSWPFQCR